ncbi:MAG TPA: hypothetical protein ENH40_05345 [Nitrospirae bacterium]|nr:hypothetical protein [Nitrospirota bacterium]
MNPKSEKEAAIIKNKRKSKVNLYKNLLVRRLTGEITHKEFIEGGRKLGYDMDSEEQFYNEHSLISGVD